MFAFCSTQNRLELSNMQLLFPTQKDAPIKSDSKYGNYKQYYDTLESEILTKQLST